MEPLASRTRALSSAAVLLFGFSLNPANAQEVIVDINVIGENINELNGREQILRDCASLANAEVLTAEQQARLDTCEAIDELDPNDAQDLAQLQAIESAFVPEEYFVISDAIVYQSDYQTTNVYQRLETIRSPLSELPDSSLSNLSALRQNNSRHDLLGDPDASANSTAGGAAADSFFSDFGVFINGQFSDGDVKGAGLQQDNDFSTSNFSLGVDYRVNENVVTGAAIGFINSSTDFVNVAGGNDSSGANLTFFGTWYEADIAYVDFVIDFGRTSNDLDRQISRLDEDDVALVSGSTDASVFSITTSAGRTFSIRGWETGVYARIGFTSGTIDGFDEQFVNDNLGTGSRFTINDQDVSSTKLAIGGEVSRAISTAAGVFIPKIRLEWESESETSKDSIVAEVDGDAQGYIGTERDSSYTNIGVGGSFVLKNGLQLFGFFESHLQHDFVTQNWIKLGGRIAF